ncbi:hypothetical protein QQG09_04585 [Melissococcus plutonius]|uniref:Uncharacterized protein n=3 Tax=Melissococcus plutonius TaxID=33970 RepID=A0A2Z5Y416_9ENTE|nr:hypothetical protein [Melissococcus plutonius]BAL62578.1 hypothetical protein MPD5_1370 [Melissococcus plutonius DAT561]MCV2498504.1 hypothetical protein [Melissococcus plutonius]MCV2501063.1 hypothetical protein [Melissococcus plutonius]MCV2504827.1 hypothetical protein [Melissococcus plutonius]MCV2507288.1 hypothetical protein [Melissococcus plutonius]
MSIRELVEFFYINQELLKNISILYFGKGTNEFKFQNILSYKKDNKFSIDSINGKQSFLWLNTSIVKEMVEHTTSSIYYNNCIYLDTQVISYLMKLLKTRDKDQTPLLKDTYEILYYLKERNTDFSAIPYLMENSTKINNSKILIPMFENLTIYDFYMGISFSDFINLFENENTKMNLDFQKTDETISIIRHMSVDPYTRKLLETQKAIQCLLLHTSLLSLKTDKTLAEKIESLYEFSHHSICSFLERELIICYRFLKNSNDPLVQKFFKKIKIGSKNISGAILGMSWDLFHIRMLAMNMISTDNEPENLDMHSLLTFDKGMSEVLQIHPVKMLIFINSTPYWIFKQSIKEIITEVDILEYYTPLKKEERAKKRLTEINYDNLITCLQNELTQFKK